MYQSAINIKNKLQHLLLRIPAKPIIKYSNKLISMGGKLTDILYKQGAKANSVFEVPNAVDGEWILSNNFLNADPFRNADRLGRYERRKGIEEINQVITQLAKEKQDNFQIHFVGPIPQEKQLAVSIEQQALGSWSKATSRHSNLIYFLTGKQSSATPPKSKNPSNNLLPTSPPSGETERGLPLFTYHGTITKQQTVQQLLLDSDVLLCPSYSEGMPTVILEAMSCGCAIIATDVGASGELVDNTNGLLIKGDIVSGLKTAMLQALSVEENTLQQMKEKSINKIKEKYTWDVVARRTLEVIRK